MIIAGIVLVVLSFLLNISILLYIGLVLIVIGAVLLIMGLMGRQVGGRRHYF
jgi:hypothetical protein